jgi:hypothetical protein
VDFSVEDHPGPVSDCKTGHIREIVGIISLNKISGEPIITNLGFKGVKNVNHKIVIHDDRLRSRSFSIKS